MLAALIPALLPVVQKLIDHIPDPDARAKAQAEANAKILELLSAQDAAQMQINQTEAANPSLFVSGWRPAVGWLCVAGLAFQTMLFPLAGYVLSLISPGTALPVLDTAELLALLFPRLGLGGYRTIEKIKGAAR